MDAASSGSTDLPIPISLLEYPGMRAELVIGDTAVVLQVLNPRPDMQMPLVEIRLPLRDFVARQGPKLQFCSTYSVAGYSGFSVDFAGMGGNAWYHVTCGGESIAVTIAERIAHLRKVRRNPLLKYFESLLHE
jgi:hypothetical protein